MKLKSIRVFLLILMAMMILCLVIIMFSSNEVSAAGGSGTPSDPYIIENLTELQDMNLNLSAHYKLGNDIDANATMDWPGGFEPIGNFFDPFNGSFDGNSSSISNLYINRPATDYVGLFGYIQNSEIKNVSLDNFSVRGQMYVGNLIGRGDGSAVHSCTASGNITGTWYVGGLIGYNKGDVTNCTTFSETYGITDYIGGIIGNNDGGAITDCHAHGNTTGNNSVGGLIGENNGNIEECTSDGITYGLGKYVGGLIGSNSGNVTNCTTYGDTDSGAWGPYGDNPPLGWTIEDYGSPPSSVWDYNDWHRYFFDTGYPGGTGTYAARVYYHPNESSDEWLITPVIDLTTGIHSSANLHFDHSWDNPSGNNYGYVKYRLDGGPWQVLDSFNSTTDGHMEYNLSFAIGHTLGIAFHFFNPDADINVSGFWFVDNVRVNFGPKICIFEEFGSVRSNISTTGDSDVGGLIGYNKGGTIINCNSHGYTGGIRKHVGGLIGYNDGGAITGCHAYGNTTGNNSVGGLIGENNGNVTDCTTNGISNGLGTYIGGLIGSNNGNVTNCTAYGNTFTGEWGPYGDNPPFRWTITDNGDPPSIAWDYNDWHRYMFSSGHPGGTDTWAARVSFLPIEQNDEELITPAIDVSGFSSVTLEYDTFYDDKSIARMDYGYVDARFDGGSWSNVYTYSNTDDWGHKSHIFTVPPATSTMQIRWCYVADNESFWFVDNVRVSWGPELRFFEDFEGVGSKGLKTGDGDCGGLIGYNIGGAIIDCDAHGYTNGLRENVGGLIGRNVNNAAIINCTAYGNTTGHNYYVGGLIGYNDGGNITNCIAHGNTISKRHYVGGLIGRSSGATIRNCIAYGNTTGLLNYAGGLIGACSLGTVTNCIAWGNTNGTGDMVGGLIGVSNSEIINCTSYGNTKGGMHLVGGLIGSNNGPITNCRAYGNTQGVGQWVGGLLGKNLDYVTNCNAYGNTNGTGLYVGGLIGQNKGGLVTNCTSYGDTIGADDNIGGLIGDNSGFVINCTSHGNTTGSNYNVGGLIGYNNETVINCSTYGRTNGNQDVGGLIGYNFGGTVAKCTTYGNTNGTDRLVGGLIGSSLSNGKVDNCTSYGDTSGGLYLTGGLIGTNSGGAVLNCQAYGNVTGNEYVGGLIGHSSGTVANCNAYGKITGNIRVGGLMGSYSFDTVTNCTAWGDVTGSEEFTGGFIGYNNGGTISYCFSKGSINGNTSVGGLIGTNDAGSINDCYTHSNVIGNTIVGGLIGNNSGTITNCYSSGNVDGNTNIGGLAGLNYTGSFTNCFWDNETSGWLTSDGGTGKNTRKMMQQATFTNAGWDFTNIWGIIEANSYPFLRALETRPHAIADLNITMDDSIDLVLLGDILIYYVNITCFGPNNAGSVVATISLPSQVSWLSDNKSLGPPDGSNNLTWEIGSLNNGERISCEIQVTVDTFGTGVITCNGFVISVTFDPGVYANNTYEETAINRAPTASDDINTTDEDTILNVAAPGILGNDSDPDFDPITIIAYDNTTEMGITVIVNGDGSYSYDPTGVPAFQALAMGESFIDRFNYTISDGRGGINNATVNITVNGANDNPGALDDIWFTDEESALNVLAPGILDNDTDIDTNDVLSVIDFDSTTTFGVSITVNADGSFSYDPTGLSIFQTMAVGESRMDRFNYTIGDSNGGFANATVYITVDGVNDDPMANDDAWIIDEDSVLNVVAPGVLTNDTDLDANDVLTVIAFDATSALGANVIVNAEGNFSYDPTGSFLLQSLALGEGRIDSFNYSVSDGHGGTFNATVYITVSGVNDYPLANDDSFSTDEDTVLIVVSPGILINDSDPDTSDVLSVIAFDGTSTLRATVTLDFDGSFSYDPTGSTVLQVMRLGENFIDSFVYTVSDGNGGTYNATVIITVTGINDEPEIVTTDVTTAIEDILYTVDYDADDIDSSILIWSLDSNATWLSIDNSSGVLDGIPDDTDIGWYWVNVSVDDGHGSGEFTYFTLEVLLDTDSDGIPDITDTDDDGDNVLDVDDDFPLDPTEDTDSDSDGTGDNADTDDDDDGVIDEDDDFQFDPTEDTDTDSDGIGDNADNDDDGDGVIDEADDFPFDPGEYTDTDSDGTGDNADTDDDGDNVLDENDDFPFDPEEYSDSDSDGIGDNADIDDDNDGVLDVNDDFPHDPTENTDTDSDGKGNNADTDDDNDGMSDDWEDINGLDPLVDDSQEDNDNDGLTNLEEYQNGSNPNLPEESPSEPSMEPLLFIMNAIIIILLVLVLFMIRKKDSGIVDKKGEGDIGPVEDREMIEEEEEFKEPLEGTEEEFEDEGAGEEEPGEEVG
jgi:hypothetical protein